MGLPSSIPGEVIYDDGQIAVICGDCHDVLPHLAHLAIDGTVTDPPYGTGGWRRASAGQGSDPRGSLMAEDWDDGATDWIRLLSTPVLMTFCPSARTLAFLQTASAAGYAKHRALYMRKRDPMPLPAGRIRWAVEPIWVMSRGPFQLYGGEDILDVSTPRANRDEDGTGHPYQKPIGIMTWLLGKTRWRSVLDPFAGSGTTMVAAKMLGMRAIGVEASRDYCHMIVQRLTQTTLPLTIYERHEQHAMDLMP